MRRRAGVLLSAALLLAVAGLVALQVAGPWEDPSPAGEPRPWPAAHEEPRVELGVTTAALARNAYRPWKPADLSEVNAFEQLARRHAGIVMWFADWAHNEHFDAGPGARGRGARKHPGDHVGAVGRLPRHRAAALPAGPHRRGRTTTPTSRAGRARSLPTAIRCACVSRRR